MSVVPWVGGVIIFSSELSLVKRDSAFTRSPLFLSSLSSLLLFLALQSRVLVSVSVTSPDLYHVVLRFANWAGSAVLGRVSVIEDEWSYYCGNCKWNRK